MSTAKETAKEALTLDDRETVIKVIGALIAEERMTVALTSVDAPA
ncbi:MAG: hypothetical protein WBQ93_04515 [Candidatus Competibacter sp.]|jgi:hypothetical protein